MSVNVILSSYYISYVLSLLILSCVLSYISFYISLSSYILYLNHPWDLEFKRTYWICARNISFGESPRVKSTLKRSYAGHSHPRIRRHGRSSCTVSFLLAPRGSSRCNPGMLTEASGGGPSGPQCCRCQQCRRWCAARGPSWFPRRRERKKQRAGPLSLEKGCICPQLMQIKRGKIQYK